MKAMTACLKGRAQFLEVIDLTVEDEPDRSVLIAHRLTAGCRYIDDGESIVGERDVLRYRGWCKATEVETIWPAMSNCAGHPLDGTLKLGSVETLRYDSGYSAHRLRLSLTATGRRATPSRGRLLCLPRGGREWANHCEDSRRILEP